MPPSANEEKSVAIIKELRSELTRIKRTIKKTSQEDRTALATHHSDLASSCEELFTALMELGSSSYPDYWKEVISVQRTAVKAMQMVIETFTSGEEKRESFMIWCSYKIEQAQSYAGWGHSLTNQAENLDDREKAASLYKSAIKKYSFALRLTKEIPSWISQLFKKDHPKALSPEVFEGVLYNDLASTREAYADHLLHQGNEAFQQGNARSAVNYYKGSIRQYRLSIADLENYPSTEREIAQAQDNGIDETIALLRANISEVEKALKKAREQMRKKLKRPASTAPETQPLSQRRRSPRFFQAPSSTGVADNSNNTSLLITELRH